MIRQGCAIFGSNTCPIGYKVIGERKNKKLVKNTDEEELTNFIFDTLEITQSIRKTSILISQKYNRDIHPQTIKKMAKNTLYYGTYRTNENYCPAYMDKDRYDRIQQIFHSNVKCNKKYEYIFTSLLVCNYCKNKMSGQKCKDIPVYRCSKYKANRSCTCANHIKEEEVETFLLNNLFSIKEDEIKKRKLEEKKKENRNYNLEIDKLVRRKNKLSELYLDDKIDKDKYYTEYERLTNEIENLETEKNKDEDNKPKEIFNLPDNFKDIYNNLNPENKRTFWRRFIKTISADAYAKELKDKYKIILK